MLRTALVVSLVLVGCRREAPSRPLQFEVLGASAVQQTDAGIQYWFDAPANARIATAEPLRVSWAGKVERTGDVTTLSRPGNGTWSVTLESGTARATVQLGFRESLKPLTERFSSLAKADVGAARRELEAVPSDQWSWACAGIAGALAPTERAAGYLFCAEGADARGLVSEGVSRRNAAFYWAQKLRQHALARRLLGEMEQRLAEAPDVLLASRFHFLHAGYLSDSGSLREARVLLKTASAEAERAAAFDEAATIRGYAATVASEEGRHLEALNEVGSLPKVGSLSHRNNLAWVELRALNAGVGHVDVEALRIELEAIANNASEQNKPLDASNYASNLAWLELSLGRTAQAREALSRARAWLGGAKTSQAVFLDWLDGRLALASGDGKAAVRAFEAMSKVDAFQAELAPDSSWRAQLGLAEAWLLQRKPVEATQALAAARRSLSVQARVFSDPRERVVFLQDRRTAIADAVHAFVKAGKCELAWRLADDAQASLARSFEVDRRVRLAQLPAEARSTFEAAEEKWSTQREALLAERAPSLASVEEVDVWRSQRARQFEVLAAEALRLAASLDAQAPVPTRPSFEPSSLARDEALLEFFDDVVFLVRSNSVSCANSPQQLPKLHDAAHVSVVDPAGHFSPELLRAFAERSTITFVPGAAWLKQTNSPTQGAPLVIGDPRRDLPAARDEARTLAKQLEGELLEGDAATLEAITSRWTARPLLHFAGHGRVTAGAPWEARLDLARGQSLDFELLLSRRPAPGLVVLSGCETGRPLDGIGLAEGFLAAGARHVLATTVEVKDEDARRFVERFYRLGGLTNPAEAFRLAVKEADDDSWREWRLFGAR